MRILLVSHNEYDINSGAQRVYIRLAEQLRTNGFDVDLYHLDDLGIPKNRLLRLLIKRFALPNWISLKLKRYKFLDYDVIMTSSGMLYPLYRKLKKLDDRPILVNHVHGLCVYDHVANTSESMLGHWKTSLSYKLITGPFQVRWDRLGFMNSDLVIVQNQRDKSYIKKNHYLTNIGLVPPSIHNDLLKLIEERSKVLKRDPFKILYFASWESRKGSYYIPDAFRIIRSRFPAAELTIGGTRGKMDEIIEQFSQEDRPFINLVTNIDFRDHVDLMLTHSIFLFPSLSEGFGLAALEAAAAGMVVVSGATGFCGDHLQDSFNARIIPVDSWHIGAAVIDLMEKHDSTVEMSKNAAHIAHKFNEQIMSENYAKLFLACIRQSSTST